jgi:carboxylate-amine ligase
MNDARPTFTIGIEEEYLLVDKETRDLAVDPPAGVMADCKALLGKQVSPEFFRCQIEVGTQVATSLADARADLAHLRRTVADCAGEYGLAPIAAGIHPFSDWSVQLNTDKPRYHRIAADLAAPGRRLVICGMHVHVAVEDEAERFDLFNQAPYFLPHLLALSTSSPFWRGEPTGMHSYRLATQRETPRTGLPPSFAQAADYHRSVDLLVRAGVILDATYLWWDLRPSARYPTLELRITDACTAIDDGITIAALYRCTLRMLSRLRAQNLRWRSYSAFLLDENRWLAQRFGRGAALLDFSTGAATPFADLVAEWLDLIAEDVAFFGCEKEVAHVRRILADGTSADRQLAVYERALADGATAEEALRTVVDYLIAQTVEGCGESRWQTLAPRGSRAMSAQP